tara:strand:+ start:632 stop:1489 length:858 start_codon:yes stop_codon:yes gene_type:complete
MWNKEFIVYPNIFNKERCEAMVELYKHIPLESAQTGINPVLLRGDADFGNEVDPVIQTGTQGKIFSKHDVNNKPDEFGRNKMYQNEQVNIGSTTADFYRNASSDWVAEDNMTQQELEAIKQGKPTEPTEPIDPKALQATIGDGRKSDVAWLRPDEHAPLFDIIWKLALHANQHYFGFHIDELEQLQFTEYDAKVGGKYDRHIDTFWMCPDSKHRKLSAVIQLTDPDTYKGGDFKLYGTNETPPEHSIRAQGSVIFFPSMFEHEAQEVTEGLRHSLVGWFQGPKWR